MQQTGAISNSWSVTMSTACGAGKPGSQCFVYVCVQVLVQGCVVTETNVNQVMEEVRHQLQQFESCVANSLAEVIQKDIYEVYTLRDQVRAETGMQVGMYLS